MSYYGFTLPLKTCVRCRKPIPAERWALWVDKKPHPKSGHGPIPNLTCSPTCENERAYMVEAAMRAKPRN